MANQNDGCFSLSPTAIVMFTVTILQQATEDSLPISSLMKRVLNFMRNPKLAHILVQYVSKISIGVYICCEKYCTFTKFRVAHFIIIHLNTLCIYCTYSGTACVQVPNRLFIIYNIVSPNIPPLFVSSIGGFDMYCINCHSLVYNVHYMNSVD